MGKVCSSLGPVEIVVPKAMTVDANDLINHHSISYEWFLDDRKKLAHVCGILAVRSGKAEKPVFVFSLGQTRDV